MDNLFIQLIAIVALIVFTGSFHSISRKKILLWQIVSIILWGIHYSLLGAWAGTLLISINGLATILFLYKDDYRWLRSVWVLAIVLAVSIVATIATWKDYSNIFALLGLASIIIAKWQTEIRRIRTISIFASMFWIVYDVYVGSWGGILSETVIILSIVVSLMRKK
jgi:hypothetical protein